MSDIPNTDGAALQLGLAILPHDALRKSATNPRKRFAEEPLRDLAANILHHAREALRMGGRELGIKEPLYVRAVVGLDGYEIISGERRWRASELAMEMVQADEDAAMVIEQLLRVPAFVVDWPDERVIEWQLAENIQRNQLTETEEAGGFQLMIQRGMSAADVARALGISAARVSLRLRLLLLPELARALLDAEEISAELAIIIAGVPTEAGRRLATLLMCFFPGYEISEGELEKYERMAKKAPLQVMGRAAALELVAERFRAPLDRVAFSLSWPVDGVDAPPCLACPHFVTNGSRKSCGQPECREKKIAAHWAEVQANAELCGNVAKKQGELFDRYGQLLQGSEYVEVSGKPDASLTGTYGGKVKTWGELLAGTGVQRVVVLDAAGGVHDLVRREVAVQAVVDAAVAQKKENPLPEARAVRAADDAAEKEQQRKAAEQKKRDQRTHQLLLAELARGGVVLGLEESREVASWALHALPIDALKYLCAGLDMKPDGDKPEKGHYAAAICEHLVNQGSLQQAHGVLVACVVGQELWRGLEGDTLTRAVRAFNLSMSAAKQQAKDEVRGKVAKVLKPVLDDGHLHGTTQSGAPVELVEKIEREEVLVCCESCGRGGFTERGLKAHVCRGAAEGKEEVVAMPVPEDGRYHCDVCGSVCHVPAAHLDIPESSKDGEFLCIECDPKRGWPHAEDAEAFEEWLPGDDLSDGEAV